MDIEGKLKMNVFGYHKERHYEEHITRHYKYMGVEFHKAECTRDAFGMTEVWKYYYEIPSVDYEFRTLESVKNYIKRM